MYTKPLHQLLPYWEIHQGVSFLEDGRFEVGAAVDVGPDLFRSAGDRQILLAQLRGLLESVVPTDQRLRVIVESRRGSAEEIAAYRARKRAGRAVFRMLAEERARMQERLARRGQRLSWKVYFLVSGGRARAGGGSALGYLLGRARAALGLAGRAAHYLPFSPGEFEEALAEAHDLRAALVAYLRRGGLEAEPMDDQAVFGLCYRFLNDHEPPGPYRPDPRYASERTLRADPELDPQTLKRALGRSEIYNLARDYLHLGEDYVRLYTMYGPPAATRYGLLADALINERAYLVLDLEHPVQGAVLQRLENKKRQAWQLSSDAASAPESSVANAVGDLLEALQRQEKSGEHFLRWGASLLVRGESVEHLDAIERIILPRLGDTLGAKWRRQQEYLAHPFSRLLPFSGRSQDTTFTTLSENAAQVAVFFGPWVRPKLESATCLTTNRFSAFVGIDLFDPKATNWNTAVLGASGSGKTFTVQSLLSDAMAEGDLELILVDKKGDYAPLVSLAGGATIPIAPGAGVTLNMFDLPPGETEPSEEKLTFLQRVFHILKGNAAASDPDFHLKEQLWMEAVRTAYRAARERVAGEAADGWRLRPITLSEVLSTLGALGQLAGRSIGVEEKAVARKLAVELSVWTQGAMGRFLDGQTNVHMGDNPVIYFDIAGFDAFDDVRVTALGVSLIAQLIYARLNNSPRDRRKIVVFDEAHAVFKIKASADLVTDLYRRARSYGAGVWTMTQSITDYQGPYVQGVLDSTSVFMILRVPEQEELVVQTLGLPEACTAQLRTLERRNGEWSELLYVMRREDSRLQGDILRVAPTPLDYWAFTSSAADVARRRRLEAERGSLLAALGELSGAEVSRYKSWFEEEQDAREAVV
ncbi:VirB4 family type IV secretion system protein [Calidithermus chliarophilus]|uniref:VirB4 family type IV secretion system protein n=1 Tax=Calidithermus chliarophilus TaxID=52023 RepID=UPI00040C4B3A|nr:DUF87 domain-containing protein [Calidithermus chliarophilus]